jgi:hypothetical protein
MAFDGLLRFRLDRTQHRFSAATLGASPADEDFASALWVEWTRHLILRGQFDVFNSLQYPGELTSASCGLGEKAPSTERDGQRDATENECHANLLDMPAFLQLIRVQLEIVILLE